MKAIVLTKDNVEPKVNNLVERILINHFTESFFLENIILKTNNATSLHGKTHVISDSCTSHRDTMLTYTVFII